MNKSERCFGTCWSNGKWFGKARHKCAGRLNEHRACGTRCCFVPTKRPFPNSNADLKLELEELGFTVFDFSLLKHELRSDFFPSSHEADAYLFSSVTGVDAFALKGSQGLSVDLTKPVLAVGAQTAEAASALGFSRVFAGSHGLHALAEEGWKWLQSQGTISTLLSVGVIDPSHKLSDVAFWRGLSGSAQDYYGKLKLPYWSLYQTVPVTDAVGLATQKRQLKTNLSKIKYFSFFSVRNASVFKDFLVNQNSGLDELRSEMGRKTLVCNSAKVADIFKADPNLNLVQPLFKTTLVSNKPSRSAYLDLMSSLKR
ncbi:MAG: uroporphyrinogen-III synthase [Alphaproteobacteria bacterium]